MSLVQIPPPERRPSPGLTITLSSNNPFRNLTASPASQNHLPSPQSPTFNIPSSAPERPLSRNPFLDHMEIKDSKNMQQRSASPQREIYGSNGNTSFPNQELGGNATDLFNNLTLNFNPPTNRTNQPMAPPSSNRSSRAGNNALPAVNRMIHPAHRPSRSQEEEHQRLWGGDNSKLRSQGLDIFADPPEAESNRRPRRNSESSIAGRPGKLLDPEDERRRRERRHKEREARHRGEGRRPQTARPKKPSQRLDIIDQLDVTSIYGTGLFHHDGPFDACNPHRNRKGSQRAPMQAFPKDSANNAIGGSGPVHKNIDFAQFHGRGAEGFTDYSTSGAAPTTAEPGSFDACGNSGAPMWSGPGIRPRVERPLSFNPISKVEPVHGDESMGLGTSTFLEGAPASRTAIHRVEAESDQNNTQSGNSGGLGRKKSLVQKIKGISNANRGVGTASRVTSPNVLYERTTSPTKLNDGHPLSAGGTRKFKETNPFFKDYDDGNGRMDAMLQAAQEKNRAEENLTREQTISSPKKAIAGGIMERRATNDGTGMINGETKNSGGFLARVKSLKGGRRAKPEVRV